jgi:AcrR family transcriptional regulator
MPRAGLGTGAVVDAAAKIADADGLEAVTLARVARTLGVRPPSLYAHVASLGELRERLATRGLEELAAELGAAAAGRAATDALRAIANAYRAYAHTHPGLYAAVQPAGTAARADAGERVIAIVLAVLRGYGLEGEDAIHATRAIRAALHGFAALEAEGGFGIPISVDESFDRLVETIDRGLQPHEMGGHSV